MGSKIWFLGATLFFTETIYTPFKVPYGQIVGAVLMWVGSILLLFNR